MSNSGGKVSGGGGTGDLNYVWTQSTPATVWPIPHGLGKYPSVSVVDTAGDNVEGLVDYIDGDNLTITYSAALAGQAYLN